MTAIVEAGTGSAALTARLVANDTVKGLQPVTVFPHAVEIVTRFLPTTLGVQALNTTPAGRPLSAAWADGTLPWLVVHTAVTVALGWTIYTRNIRRAGREAGV